MKEINVAPDRIYPPDWRVEVIDDDGGIDVTIFGGPDAESHARSYADWIKDDRRVAP